jgi:peptidoglycan/LPS O-acetylase OafA/YrhL
MLQNGVGAGDMEVVYWTLYVEVHFYVLVALLIWGRMTYSRWVGFMTAWLFIGVYAQESHTTFLQDLLIVQWAPYFIAGMAFYLMYRFGGNLVLWLIVGACWALSVYYALTTVPAIQALPGVQQYFLPSAISAFFLVMALVAYRKLSWLRWKPLTAIGGMTYPLYLVHETIDRVVIKKLDTHYDKWLVLAMALAGSLVTSALIYYLLERPAQRLMRPAMRRAIAAIRAGGTRPEPVAVATPPSTAEPSEHGPADVTVLDRGGIQAP